MRLYNQKSCTPVGSTSTFVAPTKTRPPLQALLPQSAPALGRKWSPRKRADSQEKSVNKASKITSAFFNPFEWNDEIKSSDATSATEKLTPVVSAESYDLFATSATEKLTPSSESYDLFAVSEEFITFPEFPRTGDVDLFNDANTWMTSSTLSTKFTNHEMNASKKTHELAFSTHPRRNRTGFSPLDKRPDEVFVRTPQPQYDLNDTTFPDFDFPPKSGEQWGKENVSFDPFRAPPGASRIDARHPHGTSAPEAFRIDARHRHADHEDPYGKLSPRPGDNFVAVKANLRKVPRDADRKSHVLAPIQKEAPGHGFNKKDHSLYPIQESKLAAFASRRPFMKLSDANSELDTAQSAAATEKACHNSHLPTRAKLRGTQTTPSSMKELPNVPRTTIKSTINDDARAPAHYGGSSFREGGFRSSSETQVDLNSNNPSRQLDLEGAPKQRPAAHSGTSSSSKALAASHLQAFLSARSNNAEIRAEPPHPSSQQSNIRPAGAPGSFLDERIMKATGAYPEVRPSQAAAPLGSPSRTISPSPRSPPLAAKIKELTHGKSARDILNIRFRKKSGDQSKLEDRSDATSDQNESTGEKDTVDSQEAKVHSEERLPLKDDPKYAKYFKMLGMGLPMGAVRNALQRDGLDPTILDGDHGAPAQSTGLSSSDRSPEDRPPLRDDPAFAKYFKMLGMGLPIGAVRNALQRDGLDPTILDGDHDAPAPSTGLPSSDRQSEQKPPLKDDPAYAKYFKMIGMGLPMGAVKNAMERDGVDSSVMDGDHSAPVSNGNEEKHALRPKPAPKDKFRRTRVHWECHDVVRSNTMWAMVKRDADVTGLHVDDAEFTRLFQAEAKPVQQSAPTGTTEQGVVKVIDKKRANNGGITLARIKLSYEEIAASVNSL